MNKKKVGIIGATSPLGIQLVSLLSEQGYKVYASYRTPKLIPKSWWQSHSITCVKVNLDEFIHLKTLLHKCDVFVWLAHIRKEHYNAQERHDAQKRYDAQETDRNVLPFKWFCEQLSMTNKKLIFISSGGSVYGEPNILPIPEEHLRNPLASYGKAKKYMEDILVYYGKHTSLNTAILRPGNIYGAESLIGKEKDVIGVFFRCLAYNKPILLIDKGNAVRDFISVNDVTRAILCAIETGQEQIVWNVGTGVGYSVFDILQLVCETIRYSVSPNVVQQPASHADVKVNILSIEKIKIESGWEPQINIKHGLSQLAILYQQFTKKE